ncbi:four-carbon acid sugar kinase family protein [Bradyrhizobium sp. Ai1a-2]|uniref:four-carbon acid sugar kinase family protein n=1 Tax=Bradyrhizobium sp. Ai1a-2 TaxID=196490 RepID=UPI0004276F5E|nr:four-carbon acid sugar kinase family protein [Bradyrhizobium sp. Ai1a-2]
MQQLRLLADDLTGALDTAAEFVSALGPLDVAWHAGALADRHGSFAIDSGTRELGAEQAFAIARELAPLLRGAGIAYKKIDSLMRGPWAAELNACLRSGFWDACIVAPAFPHQGRCTRAGRQFAKGPDGSFQPVGESILDQLGVQGIEARLGRYDDALPPGVSVFDAETDDDLARVAEIGRHTTGRLLWCGSGGLASALAGASDVRASRVLRPPVLGVFGSDHPATEAQLAISGSVLVSAVNGRLDHQSVRRRLADGVAFVRLETPGPSSRPEAAAHFAQEVAWLAEAIDPPRTLIIAGGETLKAQCLAVGARALKVTGRLEPGLPRSMIEGGAWSGVDVISKSGAFGPPDLWWKLLNDNKLS